MDLITLASVWSGLTVGEQQALDTDIHHVSHTFRAGCTELALSTHRPRASLNLTQHTRKGSILRSGSYLPLLRHQATTPVTQRSTVPSQPDILRRTTCKTSFDSCGDEGRYLCFKVVASSRFLGIPHLSIDQRRLCYALALNRHTQYLFQSLDTLSLSDLNPAKSLHFCLHEPNRLHHTNLN